MRNQDTASKALRTLKADDFKSVSIITTEDSKSGYELLHTKLNPPLLASDVVHRQHLVGLVTRGCTRPLTLISAPPGYGKSTLAGLFVASSDRACAWVSLDSGDNDPYQFLRYLLAAAKKCFSDFRWRTELLLDAPALPDISTCVRYLVNDLNRLDTSFVLILDDYHHITQDRVHEIVKALLKNPLSTCNLLIVTRYDPPLPLARLRGRGLLTEVRTAELRFTVPEVTSLVSQMPDLADVERLVPLLENKTEGWPAGLRLACLYLRGRSNPVTQLLTLSGSSDYIAEYLIAEVLSCQHPEMVESLLKTSILDRFCAPLFQHLLNRHGSVGKGRVTDRFIQDLVDTNLFVYALDDEKYWFRYHHLFHSFLKKELRKRFAPNHITALHQMAGSWLEENDHIEEAFHHYCRAGRTDLAAKLVLRHRHPLMNTARYYLLNNLLSQLPQHELEQHPLLVTLRAVTTWISGQRELAIRYSAMAERLLTAFSPESHSYPIILAETTILHNVICALTNQPSSAWKPVDEMYAALPEEALFFRILALTETAFMNQISGGSNAQPRIILENELQKGHLPFSIEARGWFYLTILSYLDCDLSTTISVGLKSVRLSEKHNFPHTSGISQYFIGCSYYMLNDLATAKAYLKGVLVKSAYTNSLYVIQACCLLGFIHVLEGTPEKAESLANQNFDSAWRLEHNYAPLIMNAFRVELALLQGDAAKALRLSVGVNFDLLPPTWFFYNPQITFIKLKIVESTSESVEEARKLLVKMDRKMAEINRKCLRVEILCLLSLVYMRQGNGTRAFEQLETALTISEPHGWIRTFLDLGKPMLELLIMYHRATGHHHSRRVLQSCLREHGEKDQSSADTGAASQGRQKSPSVALTRREIEIIMLLATGQSNNEIAARLYVAPVTIKKHLQNIYKKLRVKNRLEAVRKSRDIGIIVDH
jgi:LuxR family maltose regulon positive regulatory protein